MVWIKFVEIKKAANGLLKGRYPPPQYRIYGKEIREGYEAPCFFTEILDRGGRAETRNFAKGGFTVKITYFQAERDELDQLKKVDEIKSLFGMSFRVGERRLTAGDFSLTTSGSTRTSCRSALSLATGKTRRRQIRRRWHRK